MKLYAHIIFYVKRLILSRVFPECVLMRSTLSLPPAPHWATISYEALSTSVNTGDTDQIVCL